MMVCAMNFEIPGHAVSCSTRRCASEMGENQPFPDQIDPGPENWSIAAPLEGVAVARVVLCKKVHAT